MDSIKEEIVYTIKKKRERAIYFIPNKNIFFKLWVPNWTQSKITNYCIDNNFYDANNANSIIAVIEDETGPRGYVQHSGESAADPEKSDKDWSKFIKKTTIQQRKEFISDVFEKSLALEGTYTDMAPCNLIFYKDNINFIDLESFRSFSLIFDKVKKDFENFDLNAWWKPHETAKRDVNKYLKSYLKDCLSIDLKFNIDSRENFKKALEVINAN